MLKDNVDHWCLFVEDLGRNFASALHQDLDIRWYSINPWGPKGLPGCIDPMDRTHRSKAPQGSGSTRYLRSCSHGFFIRLGRGWGRFLIGKQIMSNTLLCWFYRFYIIGIGFAIPRLFITAPMFSSSGPTVSQPAFRPVRSQLRSFGNASIVPTDLGAKDQWPFQGPKLEILIPHTYIRPM